MILGGGGNGARKGSPANTTPELPDLTVIDSPNAVADSASARANVDFSFDARVSGDGASAADGSVVADGASGGGAGGADGSSDGAGGDEHNEEVVADKASDGGDERAALSVTDVAAVDVAAVDVAIHQPGFVERITMSGDPLQPTSTVECITFIGAKQCEGTIPDSLWCVTFTDCVRHA
jgi:hypothetical protein